MAKKALAYDSWEDVEQALRERAQNQIALEKINVRKNEAIDKAKAAAVEQSTPLQERNVQIEKDIKAFVSAHKSELSGKSRKLNFGTVGYRYSTSVSLPRDKDKYQQIVQQLLQRSMINCVVVPPPEILKEALKTYGEQIVKDVGAKWNAGDKFFCEVDLDKIRSTV